MAEIRDLQDRIHENAVKHGWWEKQTQVVELQDDSGNSYLDNVKVDRTFGDLTALVHSEVSEAVEAYRERGLEEWTELNLPQTLVAEVGVEKARELLIADGAVAKPEGAFTELGDAIIRILDMAGFYGVDMGAIIEQKMAYNETRSYRHGGKKI